MAFSATELAPRVKPSLTLGKKVTFTLNSSGLTYLNSVIGSTALLCVRDALDLANTTPTAAKTWAFATSENGKYAAPALFLATQTGISIVYATWRDRHFGIDGAGSGVNAMEVAG